MPTSPLITLVLVAAAALAQDPSPTGATNNTAPPLGTPCKTNADCVGIGSACTTDFVCAVSKLDCSLTTLGQCGHDWQTVLSQPTIIGLLIVGILIFLCCLPGLLFCFFKRMFCFAIKAPIKIASAGVKTTGAVAAAAAGSAATLKRGKSEKTRFSTYNPYSAYKGKSGAGAGAGPRGANASYEKLEGGASHSVDVYTDRAPYPNANGSGPRLPRSNSGASVGSYGRPGGPGGAGGAQAGPGGVAGGLPNGPPPRNGSTSRPAGQGSGPRYPPTSGQPRQNRG